MKDFINHPVWLKKNDKSSRPIPLWIAVLTLSLLVSGPTFAIAVFAKKFLQDWAWYLLFTLAYILAILTALNRSEYALKSVKAFFDLSWNAWTAVGVALLFPSIWTKGIDLTEWLRGLDKGVFMTIAGIVYATACGRVAVSAFEFWTSGRK